MSNTHTTYKLDEAQAIMNELRTIKKAICTGEKERRDLMQVGGVRLFAHSSSFSLCRIFTILYIRARLSACLSISLCLEF